MGELPAFIVGVPEETIGLLGPEQEFKVLTHNNTLTGIGGGDTESTSTGRVIETSRKAILKQILIDWNVQSNNTSGSCEFDVTMDVSINGYVIFSYGRHFSYTGSTFKEDVIKTFDLINLIPVKRNTGMVYTIKLININPVATSNVSIISHIIGKGIYRT